MKMLFVTTISGFIPQFKMDDIEILHKYSCEVHYASNFENAVYSCDEAALRRQGVILHQIDVKKSPKSIVSNAKALVQLIEIIDREAIDMVHCNNPMGGVLSRLAGRLSKRKPYMIYTAHGFHFYQGAPFLNRTAYYLVERLLARCTDCLITINQEDYLAAERMKLRQGGYTVKIPGVGLDTRRFCRRTEKRAEMRRSLGIPEDAFHILSVGELNANKNHRLVIQALSRMPEQNIYYSVCGRGPGKQELQQMIFDCGLEQRVQLLGYRDDIPDVLQSADCFAFPSIREGLGMAGLEALACEVPLIAADNRGTREYARHGENGLVCAAEDVDGMMAAIRSLMAEDTDLRAMGRAGRQMACRFSKAATNAIMEQVYGKALQITKK